MIHIFKNLARISRFKAEAALEDANAIDLIELKIRDSETNLAAAKNTLASLIIRQRGEQKSLSRIETQIADLEERAGEALTARKKEMAQEAAEAIAELEDEAQLRSQTCKSIGERIEKIRFSIEKSHRRMISLKQGAQAAKSVAMERKAQKSINRSINTTTSFGEAERLIAKVTSLSDPFEESQVLEEIDEGLSRRNIKDRLSDAGFGTPTKTRADDVLERLAAKNQSKKAS